MSLPASCYAKALKLRNLLSCINTPVGRRLARGYQPSFSLLSLNGLDRYTHSICCLTRCQSVFHKVDYIVLSILFPIRVTSWPEGWLLSLPAHHPAR